MAAVGAGAQFPEALGLKQPPVKVVTRVVA